MNKNYVKHESINEKIVILLSQRGDITRQMLPALLEISQPHVDDGLSTLRAQGVRIYPSKGPGTPLRIALTQRECKMYSNWMRHIHLGSARRMIESETEMGQQYKELSSRPTELLEELTRVANANIK